MRGIGKICEGEKFFSGRSNPEDDLSAAQKFSIENRGLLKEISR